MIKIITCLLICTLALCQIALAKPVVRVIYFKPANVGDPPDDKLDRLRRAIITCEKFYGREIEKHGHGYKTFQAERDPNGTIVINIVDGTQPVEEYKDTKTLLDDLPDEFLLRKGYDIKLLLLGGSKKFMKGAIKTSRGGVDNIFCIVPADNTAYLHHFIAHELGHAFFLDHVDDENNIMHTPAKTDKSTNNLDTMILGEKYADDLWRQVYFKDEELPVNKIGKIAIVWAELRAF